MYAMSYYKKYKLGEGGGGGKEGGEGHDGHITYVLGCSCLHEIKLQFVYAHQWKLSNAKPQAKQLH